MLSQVIIPAHSIYIHSLLNDVKKNISNDNTHLTMFLFKQMLSLSTLIMIETKIF